MGLFGSSSSSKTENNTQNVSGGAQDGALSIVAAGDANYSYSPTSNVTKNVTDADAINNMFKVTMAALDNQQKTAEDALGLNARTIDSNNQALDKSLNFVESVKNPDSSNYQKTILYFTVAAVVIVIAINIKG